MIKNLKVAATAVYAIGWFLTWAYMTASAINEPELEMTAGFFAGLLTGWLWPIIWATEIMLWLFF